MESDGLSRLALEAEMANARVDPALARFRSMHDDSTAQALAAARTLGKEYAK